MVHGLDTIASISTPIGEAALGIIRISGEKTHKILCDIIGLNKPNIEHNKPFLSWIVDKNSNTKIDQAIITYYKAPKSYTGEDMAEISCHGGIFLTRHLLGMTISNGAVLAEKGEFTKRAFMNGKIDLVKAESIIDIIKAKTITGIEKAAQRLSGNLTSEIERIRQNLVAMMAEIEASIDFPEEVEEVGESRLMKQVERLKEEIDRILKYEEQSRIIEEGIAIAIIGRPNTGKSTLLNTLIKRDRAIVTDTPGTTTDTIEEEMSIKGIRTKMIDTAGIRKSTKAIESEGIKRTLEAIEKADMILAVFDGADDLTAEDENILRLTKEKRSIAVINKCDKKQKIHENDIKTNVKAITISAINGKGIDELQNEIIKMIGAEKIEPGKGLYINTRHCAALRECKSSLDQVIESVIHRSPADIITIDMRDAIESLGKITGQSAGDDVINEVFERFCVGK